MYSLAGSAGVGGLNAVVCSINKVRQSVQRRLHQPRIWISRVGRARRFEPQEARKYIATEKV
jgi:hypothetical protein